MDDKLKYEIIQLWRKGLDDKDIAYELEIPEHIVRKFLAKRREDQADPRNCGHKLSQGELDELKKESTD